MLEDVTLVDNDIITKLIAEVNGNDPKIKRLEKGIYEVGHFSFGCNIAEEINEWVELVGISNYGVCDNYQQIIEKCSELQFADRKFAISLTPIVKVHQPSQGGWRWHKWGPYIGDFAPCTEYLHDDPVIEKVYCFHIYEIIG